MYPSVTGFELDMENNCPMKQILECFLRLTADRWQASSWNRFQAFTAFCKDQGKANMGRELQWNEFGDLESCWAIGIYDLDRWIEFVSTRYQHKIYDSQYQIQQSIIRRNEGWSTKVDPKPKTVTHESRHFDGREVKALLIFFVLNTFNMGT